MYGTSADSTRQRVLHPSPALPCAALPNRVNRALRRSRRDLPFQLSRDDPALDVSSGNSGGKHVRDETVGKVSRGGHAAGGHGDGGGLAWW